MIIAAEYSFNAGKEKIETEYPSYLKEIKEVIVCANALSCKNKKSKEKTMTGKILFSPVELNNEFKKYFVPKEWTNYKVQCDYSNEHYIKGYEPKSVGKTPFREMDFVKDKVGVRRLTPTYVLLKEPSNDPNIFYITQFKLPNREYVHLEFSNYKTIG